jgi:hypothetical protein
MMTKIAACLLTVALCTACTSTQTASKRTTLREMYASNTNASSYNADEPAPPAEGPEDIPAEGPRDPQKNPALVPTPLIRANAAGGL